MPNLQTNSFTSSFAINRTFQGRVRIIWGRNHGIRLIPEIFIDEAAFTLCVKGKFE